jgi:hypothetical protein
MHREDGPEVFDIFSSRRKSMHTHRTEESVKVLRTADTGVRVTGMSCCVYAAPTIRS